MGTPERRDSPDFDNPPIGNIPSRSTYASSTEALCKIAVNGNNARIELLDLFKHYTWEVPLKLPKCRGEYSEHEKQHDRAASRCTEYRARNCGQAADGNFPRCNA